jgi:flavin reductase (DIM6/NTAB) family NADH-FMN oxidoreductase RutF
VSSFASISLEPPLTMINLMSTTRTATAIRTWKTFAVHILDSSHTQLAIAFSQDRIDKFRGVSYSWAPIGVPVLDACLIRLEWGLEDERRAGDNAIFWGRVQHLQVTR